MLLRNQKRTKVDVIPTKNETKSNKKKLKLQKRTNKQEQEVVNVPSTLSTDSVTHSLNKVETIDENKCLENDLDWKRLEFTIHRDKRVEEEKDVLWKLLVERRSQEPLTETERSIVKSCETTLMEMDPMVFVPLKETQIKIIQKHIDYKKQIVVLDNTMCSLIHQYNQYKLTTNTRKYDGHNHDPSGGCQCYRMRPEGKCDPYYTKLLFQGRIILV